MCEIQFIKKLGKKSLSKQSIKDFSKLMKFGSAKNRDAWGIISSKSYIKNGGEFDNRVFKSQQNLFKSSFLIGHNRYSTCYDEDGESWASWALTMMGLKGRKKVKKGTKNHHPFVLGDLSLVHNGVIYNDLELKEEFKIKTDITTDSYVILWLIDRYLKKSKEKDRTKGIIEAIKSATKDLLGSYSVFLYDLKTNSIFYFKDSYTTFHFYQIGDMIVGSTIDKNINKIYKMNKISLFIEEGNIYQITSDKNNPIVSVGKFAEQIRRSKLKELFFDVPIVASKKSMIGSFGVCSPIEISYNKELKGGE